MKSDVSPEAQPLAPEQVRSLFLAASHALRSYQFGNASPDLATSVANAIDQHIGNVPLPAPPTKVE